VIARLLQSQVSTPLPAGPRPLQIFRQLSTLPPVMLPEEEALYTRPLPFKTFQFPGEVHPGLRSYPFLGQVCRRWRQVMDGPAMLQLWSELVVDFGHELITGGRPAMRVAAHNWCHL
jgi:hypothetical protein